MIEILVNSYHHQSLKDVPEPFIVSGNATDQIIEAVESAQHHFVIGVQWHPESLAVNGDIRVATNFRPIYSSV